jgi:ACR3 family arsenite transporter
VFLAGHPDYIAGIILLGLSPCTAMVMWWMLLAKGDMAQGLINTAVNAVLMIIFYAPMAAFFLGISGIPVPYDLIFMSVLFFILVPVGAGAVSRRFLIPRRGLDWFDNVFRKRMGEISFIALLVTLIVLFSLQGNIILSDPLLVLYIAVPNLIGYVVMISWTYLAAWYAKWPYPTAIDCTLIGASSHFEVAIAVATTLYGISSGAALATVIGPLFEVPLMLSLVRFGLHTCGYFPRNTKELEKMEGKKE